MKNKKAAIELSIGTVVIIVLAMSMLILGLVLIRNIFSGATDSVDTLNEKVRSEITSLFAEEGQKVAVRLGADKTAKIEAGSDSLGIGFGAQSEVQLTKRSDLVYNIRIDNSPSAPADSCVKKAGGVQGVGPWFTGVNMNQGEATNVPFDEFEETRAFAIITLRVPDGTSPCSQKVFLDVRDTRTNTVLGGSFFIFEVEQGGVFS